MLLVGIFPVDHLISLVVDALNEAKSAGKITALAIELPPKKASKQYGYLKL